MIKNKEIKGFKEPILKLKEKLDIPMAELSILVKSQKKEELNKAKKPAGTLDQLKKLLKELEPLIKKRKSKPCKEKLEEINQFSWPDDFTDSLKSLNKHVLKYKFKEALNVLNTMINN
ncbi:MAG: hypothetical protein HOD92_05560 [Deltaproteobacteria bacterium]|jgi:hypothetical protein|nr:hypothetical protein [Deltaproteobacteria bacterium]MBT4525332.1 hypothetical protein [Deltaproteobacteria bacterium]